MTTSRNQEWDQKDTPSTSQSAPKPPAEALKEHTANAEELRAFAEAMADAIIEANNVNPKSWSLSYRKQSFFLNIGPNRMMSAKSSGLGTTLFCSDAEKLNSKLGDLNLEVQASDRTFVFPKDARIIIASKGHFAKLLESERAQFIDACRATAERNTPYWRFHSPQALDVIREISGRTLPDIPERLDNEKQNAWVIHVKRDGKSEASASLENSDTRMFWKLDVPPNSTLEVIKEALSQQDPEISHQVLGNKGGSIHRFISQTKTADIALMPDGDQLFVGTITGDASYDSTQEIWSRPVDWEKEPIDRANVSPALYSQLRSPQPITEITDHLPELLDYLGDIEVDDCIALDMQDIHFPSIDNETSKKWMLDKGWLTEIVELLQSKRQLIFFGPPGTGKTYLAEKLAKHLAADNSNYKIVQFHPSYSYEDFVEGFRPKVDKHGNLTYALTPGPLKQLAEAAHNAPNEPFFLIIDEINRGNLAKIFGELYYLLEYREKSLVLQYGSESEDEFSLPKNLFVIGTMNTADRSIAMVDAAIRRRFNFVEFSPTEQPISGLLSTWLKHHKMADEPAQLLKELNRRLDDDDYAIGPSYLMNKDAATQGGLVRIWKYSILPLLAEHFYGQRGATDRFKLAELQNAIQKPRIADSNDEADTGDVGSE